MRELGVVILGCGQHGERYLRHLQRGDVPGVTARCVQRRDVDQGQRLAKTYGVDFLAEEGAAIDHPGVDAVVVASPPACHAASLELALERGLPVLCEKPLGVGLRDRERFASWMDAPVMVAHTLRFQPTLEFLRQRKEELGPVHRQRWCQRLEPSGLKWQRNIAVAGGGSVLLTGVHLFDQLRWWWGRTPDTVMAEGIAVDGHPLENVFTATFGFEAEQRLVSVEVTKCGTTRCGWVETVGLEGQIWGDYMAGRAREIRGSRSQDVDVPADAPTLPRVLASFAAFVRGEIGNPIPIEDGLETLRMADACYLSHREGRRVHLGEISPMVR